MGGIVYVRVLPRIYYAHAARARFTEPVNFRLIIGFEHTPCVEEPVNRRRRRQSGYDSEHYEHHHRYPVSDDQPQPCQGVSVSRRAAVGVQK